MVYVKFSFNALGEKVEIRITSMQLLTVFIVKLDV